MYGYIVEAEYEDGFTLSGPGLEALSPFDEGEHIVRAIVNGRATDAGHGSLVRFSLIPVEPGVRFDLDWSLLAHLENVRPVYYRRMSRSISVEPATGDMLPDTDSGATCDCHGFGYQYLDANGENVQVVEEVT